MKKMKIKISAREKAKNYIRNIGGIVRTAEAIKAGIHPRIIYQLRDSGELEQISRGLYRLVELPPVSNPDFVIIGERIPNSVICLVSALAFHDITTQIPHEISIAITPKSTYPRIDYPPIQFYKFSEKSFDKGIQEHIIDGVKIKIYSPGKTLADCFKFRNKIGMDIVLEALKLYKKRMKFDHKKILEYAKINRVERIITPYLEAMML